MAVAKHNEYLAAQVISNGGIVSYRNLSRALKVHSNVAKRMLYDFHQTQNRRKPGSVYASYLIGGAPKQTKSPESNGVTGSDGDADMANSSFMESSVNGNHDERVEQAKVTQYIIVEEKSLEAAKSSFESISCLHVYSLEPGILTNLEALSDCNRKLTAEFGHEDLLETWKQYGTIYNPLAKRRTGQRLPPPAPPAQAMTSGMKTDQKSVQQQSKSIESRTSSKDGSGGNANSATEVEGSKKSNAKPASLKRDNSDIFKAFSKAKTEPKKDQSDSGAASPASRLDSAAEDEPMQDASEDEHEEDFALVQSKEAEEKAEANRKAKSERADKLRQMMDDEDDGEEEEDKTMQDSPAAPASPEADGTLDSKTTVIELAPAEEPQVTVSGGRRRGKRRVMKKKTTKDAEGYLVTKEEPVWESFSEDEPEPKKFKPAISASKNTNSAAKKGGKPGQGNIMTFFSKQ